MTAVDRACNASARAFGNPVTVFGADGLGGADIFAKTYGEEFAILDHATFCNLAACAKFAARTDVAADGLVDTFLLGEAVSNAFAGAFFLTDPLPRVLECALDTSFLEVREDFANESAIQLGFALGFPAAFGSGGAFAKSLALPGGFAFFGGFATGLWGAIPCGRAMPVSGAVQLGATCFFATASAEDGLASQDIPADAFPSVDRSANTRIRAALGY